jgi:hypothetical protein
VDEGRILITVGEAIAVIAIAVVYVRSRIPKQTIEEQGKLIAALQLRIETMAEENKSLYQKHIDNEKAISDLQGQIKVYKELPLKDIALSLKALEGIPGEFERITKANTKQILNAVSNVKVQKVGHQTVEHENVLNKE